MLDWERNWRGAGVVFVVLTIVAFFVYGDQPNLGASPGELLSFFHGDRTRILIATVIFCFAFLELLWFGAYALISQIVLFAWIAVLSGFLAMRPSTAQAPERTAVPAA